MVHALRLFIIAQCVQSKTVIRLVEWLALRARHRRGNRQSLQPRIQHDLDL